MYKPMRWTQKSFSGRKFKMDQDLYYTVDLFEAELRLRERILQIRAELDRVEDKLFADEEGAQVPDESPLDRALPQWTSRGTGRSYLATRGHWTPWSLLSHAIRTIRRRQSGWLRVRFRGTGRGRERFRRVTSSIEESTLFDPMALFRATTPF